jgi:predicted enzyme related to lactoylglutathione lyase
MMAQLLVNIDVDDLVRAVAFYCEAFGLSVGRRFGAFGVELLGGSCPVYLLVKAPGTGASPVVSQRRDYARHWTPVHLDFVVDDLDAALARAQRAGAVPEGEVRSHSWGRIAQLADPFGHGFCLIQFQGRGYDEIADDDGGPPSGPSPRRPPGSSALPA